MTREKPERLVRRGLKGFRALLARPAHKDRRAIKGTRESREMLAPPVLKARPVCKV